MNLEDMFNKSNEGNDVDRAFLFNFISSNMSDNDKHLEILEYNNEFIAIMFENKRDDVRHYKRMCRKMKKLISSNNSLFSVLLESYTKEFQYSVCILKDKNILELLDNLASNISIYDNFEEDSFIEFMRVCELVELTIEDNDIDEANNMLIVSQVNDYGWRVYTPSFGRIHSYKSVKLSNVSVRGIKCKFSDVRIDINTIPKEMYKYEVAGDDDCGDIPTRIQPHVAVNFYGTIISETELPLDIDYSGISQDILWLNEGDFVFINDSQ